MSSETFRTLRFVFIICFVSALLLSTLASALKEPQEKAKELDRNVQMLRAAQILSYGDFFQIRNGTSYKPARFDRGILVPTDHPQKPTQDEIFAVYQARIKPYLVNSESNLISFEEAKINYIEYLQANQKTGYAHLPLKLIYQILPNTKTPEKPEGYAIPINGFGLWDAIYGYLAIESDGDTVIGATWYQQAETAGLGADISLPSWQKQFRGKLIFQPPSSGSTDFQTAPLGITVVKGQVSQVLAGSPKTKSAVDGISGASLTGQGVTDAYADCLSPYRPFLIRLSKGASSG